MRHESAAPAATWLHGSSMLGSLPSHAHAFGRKVLKGQKVWFARTTCSCAEKESPRPPTGPGPPGNMAASALRLCGTDHIHCAELPSE